ncbi:MAG: OmpP1/FadL family transporter, partial [Chitinophagaceae bacterium]
ENNTIMDVFGYIDEYAFSGGYSYEDRLFVGLTIGIQNLYYSQTINYLETDEDYNQAGEINELGANGIGVNLKLGVAYKVTNNLRLGFALHTPTYFSITQSNAVSIYYNDSKMFSSYPNSWRFSFETPWKFIAGASYNILKRLTISADYQATLYNTARFVDYTSPYNLNEGITKNFQNSSNIRVGLEWNALRWKGFYNTNFLFLRGGYNYIQSPFTKSSGGNNFYQYNVYSCGIGYLVGVFFTDFAFSYANTKNMEWNLPNQYGLDNNNILYPNNTTINPQTRTLNFILTIGFRF